MRLVVVAAAALVVGAGVGYLLPHGKSEPLAAPAAAVIHVDGSLQLKASAGDDMTMLDNGTCAGSGGYSDIAKGAAVVIADDAGHTLTITHLEAGSAWSASGEVAGCTFSFAATVPAGLGFYGITVSHRGTVKYSEADLRSAALTLGN